jgi:hypothetical protein
MMSACLFDPEGAMNKTLFALLAACGLVLVSSAAFGNVPPPKEPVKPPPPPTSAPNPAASADMTTKVSAAAAVLGATAFGFWYLRRSGR